MMSLRLLRPLVYTVLLTVSSVGNSVTATTTGSFRSTDYDWLLSCAVEGAGTDEPAIMPEFLSDGSLMASLRDCMVVASVAGRFTKDQLTVRGHEMDWCFPPTFLSRSCRNDRGGFVADTNSANKGNGGIDNSDAYYDPYNYLFACLNDDSFPPLSEITFYYNVDQWEEANETFLETGNGRHSNDVGAESEDLVIVEQLIEATCRLVEGIRSIEGILCLVDECKTTHEPTSNPSSEPPSDQPSFVPSAVPSSPRTPDPSASPSFIPTNDQSINRPSILPPPSSSQYELPTSTPTLSSQLFEIPSEGPILDVEVHVLMRIILTNITIKSTDDADSHDDENDANDGENVAATNLFVKAIGNGIHNYIIEKNLEGHLKVDIVAVNGSSVQEDLDDSGRRRQHRYLDDESGKSSEGEQEKKEYANVSVIVRLVGRGQCRGVGEGNGKTCLSSVRNGFTSLYKRTLSEGASSGDLAKKIIEFAQILDVDDLYGIDIDPESVGALTGSKAFEVGVVSANGSGAGRSFRPNAFSLIIITILATVAIANMKIPE